MLLQFKVNNFRSIKDTVTFSMLTAANKEMPRSFSSRNYHLLKSAVIFGANASGKSNTLKAIAFMRNMVLNSTRITQSIDQLPHQPFRLNTETANASSRFEMIFLIAERKYRYGFDADNTTVYAEWLFVDEKGREARLFERDTESELFYINKQKFKEGIGVKVPNNQLFIWKCDQNGGEISAKIFLWFQGLNFIDGLKNKEHWPISLRQMYDNSDQPELLKLLKIADFGIDDIKFDDLYNLWDQLPTDVLQDLAESKGEINASIEYQACHKKFDHNNQLVGTELFDMNKDESQGTQKFFALSAPALETLQIGGVLLIDELESSLHPLLSAAFIKLFYNPKLNQHNAQLIFTSHDTNLLSTPELFEREQIWFTEKDQYGASDLYSLLEFRKKHSDKDVRTTDNLEKNYLLGRYGAIPNLGEF